MLQFMGSQRVGHDCVTELHRTELQYWSSQVALVVKNLPANARDAGSIPVLEDPQEKGMAIHPSILAWRIPWTEYARNHNIWASQVQLVKNPPASAEDVRDMGLISGLGRSPGGGHGNQLQYTWQENPHGKRSLVGYIP